MRRIFNVLVLLLALNFLVAAGSVAWLVRSGRLDRQRLGAIKDIVFPKPPVQPVALQTEEAPTSRPSQKLDAILAQWSGRTAAQQVDFIQRTVDEQAAQLDRRQRDLEDLQRQVELARTQVARDRADLEQQRQALDARQEEAARMQNDQGFQDSLVLYQSMPARQVKTIFMTLADPIVQRYLEAMQPRKAATIIKEFKTPQEIARIQRVLEAMRQGQAQAAQDGQQPLPPTTAASTADLPSASVQ